MAKEGSTLSGFMDGLALSISIGLQYGVPLKALVDKLTNTRFEPSGFTENPSIRYYEFRAGLYCPLARRQVPLVRISQTDDCPEPRGSGHTGGWCIIGRAVEKPRPLRNAGHPLWSETPLMFNLRHAHGS